MVREQRRHSNWERRSQTQLIVTIGSSFFLSPNLIMIDFVNCIKIQYPAKIIPGRLHFWGVVRSFASAHISFNNRISAYTPMSLRSLDFPAHLIAVTSADTSESHLFLHCFCSSALMWAYFLVFHARRFKRLTFVHVFCYEHDMMMIIIFWGTMMILSKKYNIKNLNFNFTSTLSWGTECFRFFSCDFIPVIPFFDKHNRSYYKILNLEMWWSFMSWVQSQLACQRICKLI